MANNNNHDQGNDNVNPSGGTDPAVLGGRARSLYERNVRIIEALAAGDEPVARVAERYGVSRQWVHRLAKRYEEGGEAALVPASRAARTVANRTDEATRARVAEARRQLRDGGMDAGARSIRALMLREDGAAPAASTIHRILVSQGLVTPEPAKRPRASLQRFEAELPNEMWQSDFTHWVLADGTDAQVLTWFDDHSRFVLASRAYDPVRVDDVAALFLEACGEHGIPASTLTDNGSVFRALPGAGHHKLEELLDAHGVRHRHGRPYHPQTQGKIERWHRTLKQWLDARPLAADLDAFNIQLAEFVRYYNHERSHSALGARTPWQAYTARAKATPDAELAGAVAMRPGQARDGNAPGRGRYHHSSRPAWRPGTACPEVEPCALTVGPNGVLRTPRIGRHKFCLGIGMAHTNQRVELAVRQGIVTVTALDTGEVLFDQSLEPLPEYQGRRHTQ
ncbi:MAG: IS481 family transposase [Bifidobacterium sp.]|nr:IS481 family transposase [Bifidobacterium sp.]